MGSHSFPIGEPLHVLDGEINQCHGNFVSDVNRDGAPEILANSVGGQVAWPDSFFWYENDGRGRFTRHAIVPGEPQKSYDLRAVDLDGDGGIDLLGAGRGTADVVWYRNVAPDSK